MPKNVAWFQEVDKSDIPLVGGKGANLGEMARAGFPVPNGFIVTSHAYYDFLKENDLEKKIAHLLNSADFRSDASLRQVSSHIMREIKEGHLSDALISEVYSAYKKLSGSRDALVAVRSSATAEDLPSASFAGQQETYLNVKGESNLLIKIKDCWASLFEPRAIFYRHENKFDHFRIGIAVPVQKMIESEESGVMFTVDPVSGNKDRIIIEAIFGLGEMIVQGKEKPDHYEIDKKSCRILLKQISSQHKMLKKSAESNKEVGVSILSRNKQKISDDSIETLAKLGKALEKHYFFPQDVEWARENGKIYLVQTRPITTINTKDKKEEKPAPKISFGTPILKGDGASPGVATGEVRILENARQIDKLIPGEILVTKQTNPDFVPAMKKASAIITDSGGRTSHAAIVSRELGIPAIVGSLTATKLLKTGQVVTVDGASGQVYKGSANSKKTNQPTATSDPDEFIKTATKVYMNLAEPEAAEIQGRRGADGVGLLRAEFMMAGIGVHPKKMIRDGKRAEFVEKLASELTKFTEAFSPRPVIYRATDFKTNEYRNLVGGKEFEPEEPNPMLGYRGAFRYIHDHEVFNMEMDAIKMVRNKKGFKNLWLMLPFVRTPQELAEVKKLISASGLYRSTNFKLWMMVEIPSNVILLDKFIEQGIDGISIGTNDLTMLILGTDRDNSEVAREYDERNPAVLWAIEKVIKTAGKHGITSSICGQAATYSEILDVAVASGVTSVSVSPDAVGHTRKLLAQKEEQIFNKN